MTSSPSASSRTASCASKTTTSWRRPRSSGPSPGISLAEAIGAGNMEAKTMGHMLQMRGEILQAIGGIMLKYGRALQQEQ